MKHIDLLQKAVRAPKEVARLADDAALRFAKQRFISVAVDRQFKFLARQTVRGF